MKIIRGLLTISVLTFLVFPLCPEQKERENPFDVALQAEKWIRSAAIPLTVGKTWHPHPDVRDVAANNLDFEKDLEQKGITSWKAHHRDGASGVDPAIFRNGKQSGFLKNNSAKSASVLYQQLFLGMSQNRKASLRGYLRTSNLKGKLLVTLYSFGSSNPPKKNTFSYSPKNPMDKWSRFQVDVEAPKSCNQLYIYLTLDGEGQVWFDDFSLNFTGSAIKPEKQSLPGHTTLYNGTPGIVLFYLELFKASGNRDFLNQATAGGQYLASYIRENKKLANGLCIGNGGLLFTMERLYTASKDNQFKLAIDTILSRIAEMEDKKKPVISYPIAEILYGGAGDGLALLHLNRALNLPKAKELAVKIGNGLVVSSLEKMKYMPNFSHGISGVGYFLACLYRVSGDKRFLDKARDIALFLEEISEDNCLIYHDTDKKKMFYLGYCHGPAGTARFFFRMWQITKEKKWLARVHQAARSIMQAGIPGKFTSGYWNNVGKCCGHTGLAEFFLGLYHISKNDDYLKFVKTINGALIAQKVQTPKNGAKWVHAEHNRYRDFTMAQSGLMQGAAGIGLWLLHWDTFEKSKNPAKPFIIMPDYPFYD
ncbi:MAG: hypothetical protein GY757_23010 [bacterium]|nr:hypothetical protein [bacterium]